MGRTKTLISNTLVFTVSNFTSKILGFLMLPLYTSWLNKEQFGTSDLIVSLVGFLLPIFTLSISSALLRFSMDKSVNCKSVFTFSAHIQLVGIIVVLILLPLINLFDVFKGYAILFFFLYVSSVSQNFFSLFARGINKIKLVGIAGIVSSFTVIICNLITLLIFNMGVVGYIISLIVAQLTASIILFLGGRMYTYYSKTKIEGTIKKEMISYSLPLIPNTLSWWMNHTSNRFILNYFCDISSVGLFSAASRMPSILVTFQGIFVQAWQISAISEYDKEDKIDFFSVVYKHYNFIMLVGCSFIIALVKPIAKILYSQSFYQAWQYTPFLLTSVVFGSMVGYYSSIYLANKKTNILFLSTLSGGIITVVLNLILVPLIGIMGSAIANTISYISVWAYLHIDSVRFIKLKVNYRKNYLEYVILLLEATYVSYFQASMISIIPFVFFLVIILLNTKNITNLYLFIIGLLKKNKKYEKVS